MRKYLLAMMLASVAATPALADPQDDRANRRAEHAQQRADRPQRAEHQQQAQQPQQQQQRVQMARPDGGRGGGWRDGAGAQGQVAPQAVAPQAYVQQRQYNGNAGAAWRQRMGQAVVQQQVIQQQGQTVRQDGRRDGTRWGDHVRSNDGQQWNGQRDPRQRNGQQWNGQQQAGNRDRDGQGWSNNWRSNPRYNWQDYRNRNRSLFRVGQFYDPFGYGYQQLSIGFTLYSGYYQPNYWLNDPYEYRLPPVYGPYRWVRYYDDAVLVDIYTGEVVDVIQGFFW